MNDKRIYKEMSNSEPVWVVDLSSDADDMVRPDCQWRFRLRREAEKFLVLVDANIPAHIAAEQAVGLWVPEWSEQTEKESVK